MAGTLEKEWNSYFVQLNEIEKKTVLLMLKSFLRSRGQKAERISLEQYNREIDEAIAEIENGEVLTHEEVVKISAN